MTQKVLQIGGVSPEAPTDMTAFVADDPRDICLNAPKPADPSSASKT
ncbi:MAG: hypothetical protein QOC68_2619 [Solirubrobacteraceae bacterium]|jgi:hypothetical protein|nr:hypothetical protein [Solirubrobacteraceae bacterium]